LYRGSTSQIVRRLSGRFVIEKKLADVAAFEGLGQLNDIATRKPNNFARRQTSASGCEPFEPENLGVLAQTLTGAGENTMRMLGG
jgi:hypothetical protein